MKCLQCGSPVTTDQMFCRSCGADLLGTGVTVADVERTNHLMFLGFVVMFAGAAVGVVGKMLLHSDAVTVVGVLAALAGMFIVVYPSLNPPGRRRQTSASATLPETFLP
ncbi:MAG TPA: zinc-ribbon domain-containing protein, partial [Pyrinomonadaceae bacterium]|nr:zinc-ribbon domain-containing protein [Pyrinomonadaceae bacterium]